MKLRYVIFIILALSLMLMLSCKGNEGVSTESDEPSDSQTDISVDTNVGGTDTDTDTDDGQEILPDFNDENVILFEGENSEYTIVYQKNNNIVKAQVIQLADYIKSTYGVEIPYKAVDRNEDISNKEIVIGDVRDSVTYLASQIESTNDFILDVCGDDYVIYAPNDALYSYAISVFMDDILSKAVERKLTITPSDELVYQKSEYKDMNFTSYVKKKAEASSFDFELLCDAFLGLSFTSKDNTTLPYRLYLPSSYDENTKYPVILFLHGAGERGNDNRSQMKNMLPALFNRQDSEMIENAIVVAPQCPGWPNQWVDTPWGDGNYDIDSVPESNELKAVLELLEVIKEQFSTDESRYYAMGISMGGFGVWDLLMRHSDMFAAAVPVCGGADLSKASTLKNIPIYTAHGKRDDVVPYDDSTKKMVEAIREAGGSNIVYYEYNTGHVMWDNVARENNLFNWLFSKVKSPVSEGPNDTPVLPR